ncbi:MAG: hypothetical protein ACOYJS_04135 [Acutalibacteraceae bacterium]
MFHNIKVDVIYYKTSTDFEMEFNLCGCCRMRLLTDKAPDRKILVTQLARAVSRSRIIMIVGSLFGEEGVIKTAAAAIGRGTKIANNSQYGIKGDEQIEIISDSVPLVTTEGIFGGCIIEQGPQTLILLSDNKNVRKNIMNNLIHPYVQEVFAAELLENNSNEESESKADASSAEEEAPAPTEPQEPEAAAEAEGTETETSPANTEENGLEQQNETSEQEQGAASDNVEDMPTGFIIDDDNHDDNEQPSLEDKIILEDEDYIEESVRSEQEAIEEAMKKGQELYAEPQYISRRQAKRMEAAYSNIINDGQAYVPAEDDDEEARLDSIRTLNISIIAIGILLLIIALVLCYCIFAVPQKEATPVAEYIREVFSVFG